MSLLRQNEPGTDRRHHHRGRAQIGVEEDLDIGVGGQIAGAAHRRLSSEEVGPIDQHLGFGARTIAIIDTMADSPLGQVAMIPMLAWIAREAPADQKATYFAVMAAFTNLALSAATRLVEYEE